MSITVQQEIIPMAKSIIVTGSLMKIQNNADAIAPVILNTIQNSTINNIKHINNSKILQLLFSMHSVDAIGNTDLFLTLCKNQPFFNSQKFFMISKSYFESHKISLLICLCLYNNTFLNK